MTSSRPSEQNRNSSCRLPETSDGDLEPVQRSHVSSEPVNSRNKVVAPAGVSGLARQPGQFQSRPGHAQAVPERPNQIRPPAKMTKAPQVPQAARMASPSNSQTVRFGLQHQKLPQPAVSSCTQQTQQQHQNLQNKQQQQRPASSHQASTAAMSPGKRMDTAHFIRPPLQSKTSHLQNLSPSLNPEPSKTGSTGNQAQQPQQPARMKFLPKVSRPVPPQGQYKVFSVPQNQGPLPQRQALGDKVPPRHPPEFADEAMYDDEDEDAFNDEIDDEDLQYPGFANSFGYDFNSSDDDEDDDELSEEESALLEELRFCDDDVRYNEIVNRLHEKGIDPEEIEELLYHSSHPLGMYSQGSFPGDDSGDEDEGTVSSSSQLPQVRHHQRGFPAPGHAQPGTSLAPVPQAAAFNKKQTGPLSIQATSNVGRGQQRMIPRHMQQQQVSGQASGHAPLQGHYQQRQWGQKQQLDPKLAGLPKKIFQSSPQLSGALPGNVRQPRGKEVSQLYTEDSPGEDEIPVRQAEYTDEQNPKEVNISPAQLQAEGVRLQTGRPVTSVTSGLQKSVAASNKIDENQPSNKPVLKPDIGQKSSTEPGGLVGPSLTQPPGVRGKKILLQAQAKSSGSFQRSQPQDIIRPVKSVSLSGGLQQKLIPSPQLKAALEKSTAPSEASLARLNVEYMQQSLDFEIRAKKTVNPAPVNPTPVHLSGHKNLNINHLLTQNRHPSPLHMNKQSPGCSNPAGSQPKHQLPPRQPIPAIINPNSNITAASSMGKPVCSVVPFTAENQGQAVSQNAPKTNPAPQNEIFIRPQNPVSSQALESANSPSQSTGVLQSRPKASAVLQSPASPAAASPHVALNISVQQGRTAALPSNEISSPGQTQPPPSPTQSQQTSTQTQQIPTQAPAQTSSQTQRTLVQSQQTPTQTPTQSQQARTNVQQAQQSTLAKLAQPAQAQAEQTPSQTQQSPTKAQQTPTQTQLSPTKAQQAPTQTQQTPTQTQQTPTQGRQTPTQSRQTPTQTQQTPTQVQQTQPQTQQTPTQTQQTPIQAQQTPSQTPTQTQQTPRQAQQPFTKPKQTQVQPGQVQPAQGQPTQPSTLGQQPSTQGQQPSTQGQQPSTQGQQPSTQGQQPSTQGQQPSTQGQQPSSQGQQPGQQPSTQGQQPSTQGQQPSAQGQQPSTQGQQPSTQGQQPSAPPQKLSTQVQQPSLQGQQPSIQGQQLSIQGQQPSIQGQQPSIQGQPHQTSKADSFNLDRLSKEKCIITGKGKNQNLVVNMVYQIRSPINGSFVLALWNGEKFEDLKQTGLTTTSGASSGEKSQPEAQKVHTGQATSGSPRSGQATYVKPLAAGHAQHRQDQGADNCEDEDEDGDDNDDDSVFKKPFVERQKDDYCRECPFCGHTRTNMKRCESCRRIFRGDIKVVHINKQSTRHSSESMLEGTEPESVHKDNVAVNPERAGAKRDINSRLGEGHTQGLRGCLPNEGLSKGKLNDEDNEDSDSEESSGDAERSHESLASSRCGLEKRPAPGHPKDVATRKRQRRLDDPVTVTISSDEDEPSSTSNNLSSHALSPTSHAGREPPSFLFPQPRPVKSLGKLKEEPAQEQTSTPVTLTKATVDPRLLASPNSFSLTEEMDNKMKVKGQPLPLPQYLYRPGEAEEDDEEEDEEMGGEDEDEEPPMYEIDIRSVRVGSMRTQPEGPLLISLEGVCIKVRSERTEEVYDFEILAHEVERVKYFLGEIQPVLYLFVTQDCGEKLRSICHMEPGNEEFFDPNSTDMKQKMIVVIIEGFSYMSQEMLRETLSLWADLNQLGDENFIEELTDEQSNDLLIQSAPPVLTMDIDKDLVRFRQRDMKKMAFGPSTFPSSSDNNDNEPDSTSSSPPEARLPYYGTSIRLLQYPPPPARRLSITTEDLFCLTEGEFLNDVIIDFYLQYLYLEKLSEENRKRTHIFSSFFYKRLMQKDRHDRSEEDAKKSLPERRHARVKKWTKTVDLFSKDFIVIPINENSHWYLAVICFPGLAGPEAVQYIPSAAHLEDLDEETSDIPGETERPEGHGSRASAYRTILGQQLNEKDSLDIKDIKPLVGQKQPCILMFDSLAGPSRLPNVRILREYLQCEWNAKKSEPRQVTKILRNCTPDVPQQSNFSDCGVYLLQYVESFFEDPIGDFEIPMEGLEHWFPGEIVDNKRREIHELIMSLHRQYQMERGDPNILYLQFESTPREPPARFYPDYDSMSGQDEEMNYEPNQDMMSRLHDDESYDADYEMSLRLGENMNYGPNYEMSSRPDEDMNYDPNYEMSSRPDEDMNYDPNYEMSSRPNEDLNYEASGDLENSNSGISAEANIGEDAQTDGAVEDKQA